MAVKKGISKKMILSEYINKDVSMRQACNVLSVCPTTFIRALREHGISPKPRTWNHRRKNRFPLLQDAAWLKQQMETKSLKQIAQELGTSQGNVSDHAKRHGIRSRFASRNEAVMAGLRKRFPDGRFGELATNWKGGRRRGGTKNGYIKNGKKADNREENLEVMSRSEHVRLHFDAVEKVHELEQEIERLKAELQRLCQA